MSKSTKKRVSYSDSFKMQVVQEALVEHVNKAALCRKYSISRPVLLYQWIRIFAPTPKLEELSMKSPINKVSQKYSVGRDACTKRFLVALSRG